jgi:hypothetical protein
VSWKCLSNPHNHGVVENKVEATNTYADVDTFHAPAELYSQCTMCSYSCLDHCQILPYGFRSFVKIHLHLFGILVTTELDSLVEGQSRHTCNVQNIRTKFLKPQCSIQSLSLAPANVLVFTLILALY